MDLDKIADVFYNMITTIEEAKVIFIGEVHDNEQHRKLEVEIINQMAKNDDIVLVEGKAYEEPPKFTVQNCFRFEPYKISKNVKLNGWEKSEEIMDKHEGVYVATRIIAKDVEEQNEVNQKARCLVNIILTKRDIDIKLERDKNMVSLVKDLRAKHPKRKIFVIAGKGHIFTQKPAPYNIFDHLAKDLPGVAISLKDEFDKRECTQFLKDVTFERQKIFIDKMEEFNKLSI